VARSPKLIGQRGIVMITVMIVMAITMSIVAVLVDQFAVAEVRAVEQTLVRARANWSFYGHLNYALSRAWSLTDPDTTDGADTIGFCDSATTNETCASDADLVTAFNNIFAEMGAVDWPYPNYTLRTSVPIATDIAPNNDGKIRIQIGLQKNGNVYDFSGNSLEITRMDIPDMYVELCVLSEAIAAPTLTLLQTTCTFGSGNIGDSGFSLIDGLFRNTP
jgi:hypothetical protein